MKKIISAVLVAALVIAMGITAFAADITRKDADAEKDICHGDTVTFVLTIPEPIKAKLPEGYRVFWEAKKGLFPVNDVIFTSTGNPNEIDVFFSTWDEVTLWATITDSTGNRLYVKDNELTTDPKDGRTLRYESDKIKVNKVPVNFLDSLQKFFDNFRDIIENFLHFNFESLKDIKISFKSFKFPATKAE